MTRTLSALCALELPQGIDAEVYDRINDRWNNIANPNSGNAIDKSVWSLFANAWNGVAYRLIATNDYSITFCSLIAIDSAPSPQDRYKQDHALFGFVSSALSSLDCLFMAAYSIGFLKAPSHFPITISSDLNKYPSQVASKYAAAFPGTSIAQTMTQIVQSDEFKYLSDFRNALSHRGALPRFHPFSTVRALPSSIPSNPKSLPADFLFDEPLVPELTTNIRNWVFASFMQLFNEIDQFI